MWPDSPVTTHVVLLIRHCLRAKQLHSEREPSKRTSPNTHTFKAFAGIMLANAILGQSKPHGQMQSQCQRRRGSLVARVHLSATLILPQTDRQGSSPVPPLPGPRAAEAKTEQTWS